MNDVVSFTALIYSAKPDREDNKEQFARRI